MRRLFLTLGLIVLLAIAAALYFIHYRLDGVVETRIERAATMAFGTRVEVGGVQTNLRDGTLKIAEISVANPPGFESAYAVRLHQVDAAVDYSAREITHLVIENPEFFIEESGGTTNFEQILQALDAGKQSKPGTADEAAGESSGTQATEPEISIKHFRIDATSAMFESRSFDRYSDVEVDAIEMHNLRGTPSELAHQIAREVIDELNSAADTEMLKVQAKKLLKDGNKKLGKALRDLLQSDDNDNDDDNGDGVEENGEAQADSEN